jgi:hypothetical protein
MKISGLVISVALFYVSTSALVVAMVFLLTPIDSNDNVHLVKICGYLLFLQAFVFYAATFLGIFIYFIF